MTVKAALILGIALQMSTANAGVIVENRDCVYAYNDYIGRSVSERDKNGKVTNVVYKHVRRGNGSKIVFETDDGTTGVRIYTASGSYLIPHKDGASCIKNDSGTTGQKAFANSIAGDLNAAMTDLKNPHPFVQMMASTGLFDENLKIARNTRSWEIATVLAYCADENNEIGRAVRTFAAANKIDLDKLNKALADEKQGEEQSSGQGGGTKKAN